MEWAKGKSACSFWGAKLNRRLNQCDCGTSFTANKRLSRECISQKAGLVDFSPSLILEADPHIQLWDPKCKCVTKRQEGSDQDRAMLAEKVQGVAAVDFCRNLFAGADQASKHDHFYAYWEWKTDIQNRVNEMLSMHRCQEQLPDPKKIEDLLESGGSLTLKQAWEKVCYDECEDLLNELRETMETVVKTGGLRKNSWSEICVEHVVKKVESHLLGCCGRSCGWNGRTCASSDGFYKMDLISQELPE